MVFIDSLGKFCCLIIKIFVAKFSIISVSRIYLSLFSEAKRAETKGICPECVFTFPQGWKEAGEDAAAYTRAGGAEEAAGLVSERLLLSSCGSTTILQYAVMQYRGAEQLNVIET